MKFQVNEGPIDRLIRILVGVGLFTVAATGLVTPPLLYGVLLVGTIGLVTGITCIPRGLDLVLHCVAGESRRPYRGQAR